MKNLQKLSDVLNNINEYSWQDSLFLPENKNWNLESNCAVLNMDNLSVDEEIPQLAIDNKLIYALSIADLQDIVENAKEQLPHCSNEEIFKAFLYYFNNDAFIEF